MLAETHGAQRRRDLGLGLLGRYGLGATGRLLTPRTLLAHRSPNALSPLLLDIRLAKNPSRGMRVMTCAEQADILQRRGPSERIRMLVLERDEAPFTAAAAFGVDKGALPRVALPDLRHHLE
jgi:hypothetical protein